MAAPALLSLKSLSERFDTPVSTLRYHIRTGKLSAVKVGGRVMIPEEEAVTFLRPVSPSGKIDAAVKAIVDAAPTLTTEQREQLAVILGGAA
ncbi:helix-turn-helix domain-containing protein [Dermabacter hominis]|uniref:helix-turn-helix domain-containing protein n=1 Tax=Dermabacter hominis TaxID=36740 RepID=UPI00242F9BB4|nr:helix-turn-helix domain-containing protein [Dermabacter hominis]